MTRIKRGVHSLKRRRKILKKAKGYRFGRSKKEIEAKVAILHASIHAFAHRRDKKTAFRQLWQVRLGAALKEHGISYSKFIGALNKKNIKINRKMLADLAANNKEVFNKLVNTTIEK